MRVLRRGARRPVIAVASALLLVGMFTLPSFANLPGSKFESDDGNLTVDTVGNFDWNSPIETITCPSTPGSGTNCGTDLVKSTSDDAFGQGAKEDIPNPTEVSGSIPPNKSDLTRFYFNHETGANGHEYVHLAWERSNILGNANMDFEFNQSATFPTGKHTPLRTDGDLLVTFDFVNGGSKPDLGLLKWQTALGADGIAGTADDGSASDCFSSNSLPCWGAKPVDDALDGVNDERIDLSAAGIASGAVFNPTNQSDTTHDSNPPPAGGTDLPRLTFGEAGIDLTAANVFSSTKCANFGSVFLKSRSSSSFTAELKDFIKPISINLKNCGQIIIRKVTSPSPDPLDTSFGYTTTGGLTPSSFSLKDGENQDYGTSVLAGSYSVTETLPVTNYVLSSIDCSASSKTHGSTVSTNTTTGTVSIVLKAQDTIDCTYTNTLQQGAIKITKTGKDANCTGVGTPTADCVSKGVRLLNGAHFEILSGGNVVTGAGDLVTAGTGANAGTVCFPGLLFGSYSVNEKTAPTGYAIDDTDPNTSGKQTAKSVSVTAVGTCSSGTQATVTFTDTPKSSIQVVFSSLAGTGVTRSNIVCTDGTTANITPSGGEQGSADPAFDDTNETITNLPPGTYTCTVVVDP